MLGSKLLKTMQMSAILLLLPQTYTIWISNAFLSIPKRAKYSASRISSNHRQSVVATTSFSARSDATDVIDDSTTTTPTKKRLLDPNQLSALDNDGYIVISDFISAVFQEDLRKDIMGLRRKGKFTVAKVGTNNDGEEEVRNAEICLWLHEEPPAPLVRQALCRLLIDLMKELEELSHETLTAEELSYLYYPKGGYFRRHVDSMPNTNVEYRTYSLLIYLNDHWMKSLGGQLRIHLDSGSEYLPAGEEPNYVDVNPTSGTLVLFNSSKIAHEVLDTQDKRIAIVSWYNRVENDNDNTSISKVRDRFKKIIKW